MLVIFALLLVNEALASPFSTNVHARVRRLAGGHDVDEKSFRSSYPFMAAIKYGGQYVVCGATILSPTQIITAASCTSIFKMDSSKSKISLGVGSSDSSQDGMNITIKKIVKHPEHVKFKFQHDIAIVTFEPALKYSENIQPVLLPKTDIVEDSIAKSVGWGMVNKTQTQNKILQALDQRIISNSDCKKLIPDHAEKITTYDFCALPTVGANKAGSCNGDSGSPLIQDGTIVGIVTWGPHSSSEEQCQSGYPDIFLNIFKYLDFINENIIRQ
ncbi:hypothetical protein QAD02_008499 [Eretmocerus hayati]|uniref:Uncharacterized protein n=1 Tax=Eretmocerus hayati TaxID=131215 RepID=A0ACC2N910_9HYME|nr:hypothetical protein QAD02_008499 [Eretmocerus hayati]